MDWFKNFFHREDTTFSPSVIGYIFMGEIEIDKTVVSIDRANQLDQLQAQT